MFGLTRILVTSMTIEQIVNFYLGGDYNYWYIAYVYLWFICYLDHPYKNIIGHQGLLHFQHDFPDFRDIITTYCQKDRVYVDQTGNTDIGHGIEL